MEGIIFDVDGTLWDSTESVAMGWNKAMSTRDDVHAEITADILKQHFGKPMNEIYNALFPGFSKEEQIALGSLCLEEGDKFLEEYPGRIFDGVEETFRKLSKTTDIYICSNCHCGYIELFLKTSGLTDTVKDHLCFGETGTSKGQTLLTLMKRNHIKDVVYVGDTIGDQQACEEAGIPFIFASYGFGDVKDPDGCIEKIPDLPALLHL